MSLFHYQRSVDQLSKTFEEIDFELANVHKKRYSFSETKGLVVTQTGVFEKEPVVTQTQTNARDKDFPANINLSRKMIYRTYHEDLKFIGSFKTHKLWMVFMMGLINTRMIFIHPREVIVYLLLYPRMFLSTYILKSQTIEV